MRTASVQLNARNADGSEVAGQGGRGVKAAAGGAPMGTSRPLVGKAGSSSVYVGGSSVDVKSQPGSTVSSRRPTREGRPSRENAPESAGGGTFLTDVSLAGADPLAGAKDALEGRGDAAGGDEAVSAVELADACAVTALTFSQSRQTLSWGDDIGRVVIWDFAPLLKLLPPPAPSTNPDDDDEPPAPPKSADVDPQAPTSFEPQNKRASIRPSRETIDADGAIGGHMRLMAKLGAGAGGNPTSEQAQNAGLWMLTRLQGTVVRVQHVWQAHRDAITSLSAIKSPPSLFTTSADRMACVWKFDGSECYGSLRRAGARKSEKTAAAAKLAAEGKDSSAADAASDKGSDKVADGAVAGAPSAEAVASGAAQEAAGGSEVVQFGRRVGAGKPRRRSILSEALSRDSDHRGGAMADDAEAAAAPPAAASVAAAPAAAPAEVKGEGASSSTTAKDATSAQNTEWHFPCDDAQRTARARGKAAAILSKVASSGFKARTAALGTPLPSEAGDDETDHAELSDGELPKYEPLETTTLARGVWMRSRSPDKALGRYGSRPSTANRSAVTSGTSAEDEGGSEHSAASAAPAPDAATAVVASLCKALDANHARVLDFFREVDVNGDGHVEIDELGRALGQLGYYPRDEELSLLFQTLDEDQSGTIEYRELHHALRRKVSISQGAAGEIHRSRSSSQNTRNGDKSRRSSATPAPSAAPSELEIAPPPADADAPAAAGAPTRVPLTARPDLGGATRDRPGSAARGLSLTAPALDMDGGSQSARPHYRPPGGSGGGGGVTPRAAGTMSPRRAQATPRSGATLNAAQAAAADKLDFLLAADLKDTKVPRRPRRL